MSALEQAAAELVVAMKRLDAAHLVLRDLDGQRDAAREEFDAAEQALFEARAYVLKIAESGR